jgi:hypothetical protein
MKNVFRLLSITALAAVFALPAFAQEAATAAAPAQDDPQKTALYQKFVDERGKKDAASQKAAYDTGKEYLTKYGAPDDQYNTYVRGWVAKYEKALRDFEFEKAVQSKDVAKAQQYGQQILAAEPDNVNVYLRLTEVGFNNAVETKNKNNAAQTTDSARRALTLIEQGKAPEKWTTFTNRDEAIGGLNYTLGYFNYDSAPDEAVKYLIKAAQSNSKFKSEPTTYIYLGEAYYNGEFKKLADEYKTKFEGQPETPEGIALYERVNQALDHVIDAYARAAALTQDAAKKKPILDRLTPFYKGRHENSDAGLNEYIAGVLNRPLPMPGQPVTPTSAPTSTGAATTTTGGSTAATSGTNGNMSQPASSTAKPASTTAPTGTAKPANTPATPAATPAPKPKS